MCGFLSVLILLTELTTFVFRLKGTQLSIIGIPIHYLKSSSMLRTFSASVSLSYIFLCFFRSFFLLRIPFVECYHLYFHHTDVYALCFNANYLCRLLQMDEGAYESIALSSVLGQMKTIPFLGSEFNFYVPVIVFLVSMFTLWKMTWGSRPHKKQVGVGGWREG